MDTALLLPLPGFEQLAMSFPGVEVMRPAIAHFENGELEVRLPASVASRDCVLLGTGAPPADRLAELLLVADTLRRHGARSVSGMLPYMAYARQDRLEHGRSLAAAWLGRMLVGAGIRAVTTVDIHSRRALELMAMPVRSLSPAPLFAGVLRGAVTADTVAVAPDRGALSRTHALASALGVERPVAWTEKERSPGGVTHKRVVGELAPRALIFDDILDTGGTLCSCCRELRARGVGDITVAVTHGLFTGGRWRELTDLGVSAIHTTDSVPGARARQSELVHVHSIAPLLTEELERLAGGQAWGAGAASSIECQRSASRSAT